MTGRAKEPVPAALQERRCPQMVRFAAIAAVVAGLATVAFIAAAGGAGASAAQRRVAFTAMVQTLRRDLASCDARASSAVSALRLFRDGALPESDAHQVAQMAARACAPGSANAIWNLSLYSVPSWLGVRDLNYAVSCLGVWAEEDVRPAMIDAEILVGNPGDRSAQADFRRLAGWAADNLASANAILERSAHKFGISGFQPLSLVSLSRAAPT